MSSCTLKTVGLAIASPTQAYSIDISLRIVASGSLTRIGISEVALNIGASFRRSENQARDAGP
jgi:hypothetical protein